MLSVLHWGPQRHELPGKVGPDPTTAPPFVQGKTPGVSQQAMVRTPCRGSLCSVLLRCGCPLPRGSMHSARGLGNHRAELACFSVEELNTCIDHGVEFHTCMDFRDKTGHERHFGLWGLHWILMETFQHPHPSGSLWWKSLRTSPRSYPGDGDTPCSTSSVG